MSQAAKEGEPFSYAQLEEAVARWGVQKFQHFKGDVIIRMKSKCKVSQFELDCSAVWPRLTGWVRHHEEVSDDVIYLGKRAPSQAVPGGIRAGRDTTGEAPSVGEMVAEAGYHL